MQQYALQSRPLGLRGQGQAPPGSHSLAAPPAPTHSRSVLPLLRQRPPVLAVGLFGKNGTSTAASSARDAQDTLVPDGAIKSLSPEARRIFREAQDNIIELNKSRLRALDELKAARQKIAELEGKLEQAVVEASQANAQLQQLGPSGTQAAAEAAAAAAGAAARPPPAYGYSAVQQSPPPPPQQQQQQQSQPPQQPSPASAGGNITIVYETGWGAAYVHYNLDNQGWTQVPGKQMQNGTQQFPDKKVLTLTGRRVEFVINDGGNDWDKPNAYSSGSSNYVISEPGTYRIKHGKVNKLA